MLQRSRDVFKSLERHEVRYVVIGGVAAILHGVPRGTLDLDILIEASTENAQRLLEALLDAGLGTAALTSAEAVLANEITIFSDRVRVDVQTRTPGITFDEAWQKRRRMTYEGQPLSVVSLEDLISAKEAAGRPIDMADAHLLRQKLEPDEE